MSRALVPLLIGALLGGSAVYVSSRLGAGPASESDIPETANVTTSPPAPADGRRRGRSGERPSTDEVAATLSDRSEHESVLRRAAADPEDTLAELSAVSPPAWQREVALAVLAALGNDDATLSRVAAMLPEADRVS